MYPNPQDVLPLPPRPDVRQYRTRAKELSAAGRDGPDAIREWAVRWIRDLTRAHGSGTGQMSQRELEHRIAQITDFAQSRLSGHGGSLAQAQLVIARAHGFASWPRLLRHLEQMAADTRTSAFERAADAIIRGDADALGALLQADPSLVHARSTREHRATLLHYVAANGVENYRQRTPNTIVAIARLLLDGGADVDAEADVYGGGATTLGLVVTSAHPRAAGVQNDLADLLLDRGARMSRDILRDCLANGCPEAAAHLAGRGAPVTLESAAGIGDMKLVDERLEEASDRERVLALTMATWYDRRDVIGLLLGRGVPVSARHPTDGETPLHIAAYLGHVEIVHQLLARGAEVHVADGRYGTTPVVWALHAWLEERRTPDERYRAVLLALAHAGARVERRHLEEPRLRSHPDLYAALAARAVD